MIFYCFSLLAPTGDVITQVIFYCFSLSVPTGDVITQVIFYCFSLLAPTGDVITQVIFYCFSLSAPTGDVVPQVIRANGHPDTDDSTPHPGYKSNLPLHTASASSSLPDTKEIEGIVRCKIVDIVSPAMVKLNERIGVLEITLEVSGI